LRFWERRAVRERDFELEETPFPEGFVFAWYAAFPFLEVENTGWSANWFCDKAERVIATPLFSVRVLDICSHIVKPDHRNSPLLHEPVLAQRHV
jgi:hypothetical protein